MNASLRVSPTAAASLSLLVPGLGQLSLGSARRGALVVLPAAACFVAAVGVAISGPSGIAVWLLQPEVLLALLIANIGLTAYHVGAVTDAYIMGVGILRGRTTVGRSGSAVLVLLIVATVALHGAFEVVGYQAYTTLTTVFAPEEPADGWSIPEPSFEATPSPSVGGSRSAEPSPAPSATPSATPSPRPSPPPRWAADGRLNVLLIGSDAGPDRWSLRTDTMVVLSVNIASGRAALFGIPRNMVGVPLAPEAAGAFPDGRFPGLLNALYVYAMGHPSSFPGGDARGFRAVTGAVQELVGVRIDSAVVVNLRGFVRLVDAIGGLWIDIPERLVDRHYPLEDGSGHIALDLRAGCQRLDGRMALAYARSRHQDSDYGRMRRQQLVLVSLARQVDPLELVPKVPDLLAIARENLWTTIKRSDVAAIAVLAARVDVASVRTVLFVPAKYPSHLTSAEIRRIREVVASVFDGRQTPARSSPAPRPATCP